MIKERNKVAIVYKDKEYSYAQLLQRTVRYKERMVEMASSLEKVLIFSENTPEYIFTIYATLRAKAVVVPVDVTSTVKELKYIVEDCRPSIVMVQSDKREFVEGVLSEIDGFECKVFSPEEISMDGIDSEPVVEFERGDMDDVVSIIYTSGTTGSPKGVMLTYRNYWYNVDAVTNQIPIFEESTRVLLLLPLHHVFPFAGAMLAPLYSGGTIYIAENLAPDTIARLLQTAKITVMIGVPRLYEALAKGIMRKIQSSFAARALYNVSKFIGSQRFSKFIFKSAHKKFGGAIKYMVSGGAALPIGTAEIFKNLGFYVLEGYGMTECAPMIAFTRPGERKVGYCGRLLKGLEMKLTDEGEICVKGPNVMPGYYNREKETADIIRDGWLHTGDVGDFHPKFGLRITGRIKEIIVTSNGKNINPVEIENQITQHSAAIKELAVIHKDDMLQAIIFPDMNVVRSTTGATIEEAIQPEIEEYNRGAMSYKRIKKFHVISHELPKTRLEKIQRYKLEKLIEEPATENFRKEDDSEKSAVYKQLKELIKSETSLDAWGDAHFEIDLALDSLGRVSLLAAIEDQFGLEIAETELDNYMTLNKLSAYVEKNSARRGAGKAISWKEIFSKTDINIKLPKSGFIHWFMTHFTKISFHLFYNLKVDGKKNVPQTPSIFVANHRSSLDGIFITSKMSWKINRKSFFFAKDKHFKGKFAEYMAGHNNVILMDINSNIKTSLQQMYQVLSQGKNVVIFPEGTRSKSGKLLNFKDSFAILSKELGVPVVPVAIEGSQSALFSAVPLPRFFSRVKVNFLSAIDPANYRSVGELRDSVSKVIEDALSKGK